LVSSRRLVGFSASWLLCCGLVVGALLPFAQERATTPITRDTAFLVHTPLALLEEQHKAALATLDAVVSSSSIHAVRAAECSWRLG
jgi:hypothetical protein